jgi:hypothetical protein
MNTTLPKDMNKWKNTPYPFTRILTKHYKNAFIEKNIPVPNPISENYSIYPRSFYKRIDAMPYEKSIDFCFIGQTSSCIIQTTSRSWINPFVMKHFNATSYLQYNKEDSSYRSKGVFDYTNKVQGFVPRYHPLGVCDYFDEAYYTVMKKSKFCLCPAGDQPWSMRFVEAIMCKSIPIVKEPFETWRSHAEQKLGYKFYYAHDKEFVYREDWVQHNYELFLRYHTLEYRIR